MPELHYSNALEKDYRLHWYTIERVLGQGGFGITYLARDTNLDQAVAIKEYLPAEITTRTGDFSVQPRTASNLERFKWGLDRFLAEARILARFDHPSIVRVHSVFEANHTAYLVMRYEQGVALNDYLDRHKYLPEQELLDIVLPVLDGLKKVHKQGFIHRDIQPANIYIREDGSPVLLDFGAAREAIGKARTMTILVAPGYAPIEQYFTDGKAQGPWTDIYGLGATLYRAVAGVAPLDAIERSRGLLGSTRDVMMPTSVAGQGRYGEAFLRAIDHALMFNEKDRPQNVEQWEQELKTLVTPGTEAVVPAVSIRQGQETSKQADPVTRTIAPPPSRSTRPGWLIPTAIISVFLLGLAITGFLLLREDPQSRAPDISMISETEVGPDSRQNPERTTNPLTQPQPGIRMDPPLTGDAELTAAEAIVAEPTVPLAMPPDGNLSEQSRPQDTMPLAEEERLRLETEAKQRQEEADAARQEIERLRAAQRKEQERLAALAAQRLRAEEELQTELREPEPPAAPVARKEDTDLQQALLLIKDEEYRNALVLLQPLAAGGSAGAQYYLAGMYRAGRGVLANNTSALEWMRKAAWQGLPEAQVELAGFYREGINGVQDRFLAYMWHLVLERSGEFSRLSERRALEEELQAEQIPQAMLLAESLYQAQANATGSTLPEEVPE